MGEDKLIHVPEDLRPQGGEAEWPPAPPPAGGLQQGRAVTARLDDAPLEDLHTWRKLLLRGILRVVAVVGALALLAGSYNSYQVQKPWLIPVFVLAYALLLLVTFWRRASYIAQVTVILVLIYGLGVLFLAIDGLSGDGRVFLLLFPFIAALFLGWREGVLALTLAVLTMVGFGYAFTAGHLSTPAIEVRGGSRSVALWLSTTVVLLMMGTLLVFSQNYLFPRLAAALSRNRRIAQELQASRAELEKRTHALQEANYALQRRAIQLQASTEVGRTIISIFDIDELLQRTVNLIRDQFGFYHAGIFLLDDSGQWAELREATGEAGAMMKAMRHRLEVGETSMVGWTALHRQARIALDVGEEAVRFDHPFLPYTRSELALPLMVGNRLLGVLNVQSTEEAAFDEDDVRVLQSMANQIAIAIENARRVSEEAALLEATSPIYRTSRRLTQATTVAEVADATITSVAETGADGCLVVLFEFSPAGEPEVLSYVGAWRRDREPQFATGTRLPIAESPFPLEMVSTLWVAPDVAADETIPLPARQVFAETDVGAVANIPLRTKEQVIGQVVVLRSTAGPFPEAAMRLYETLSDQAAVALERARLLDTARRRVEQEATLRAIGDRVARAMDVETVLRGATDGLIQALQAGGAHIELGPGEVRLGRDSSAGDGA